MDECLIKSPASLSVSRLAVPLPMAIKFTPCLAQIKRVKCMVMFCIKSD